MVRNDWGEEFENREEAMENVQERMTWECYADFFEMNCSFQKLFEFARKCDNFFETFEDEFCQAEEQFYKDFYYEEEEEEEE